MVGGASLLAAVGASVAARYLFQNLLNVVAAAASLSLIRSNPGGRASVPAARVLAVALRPDNLFYCVIGCLWGTVVGVLPGLGPLAGLTLLLPLTYQLEPASAIIMLAGIFYGAMYGGSTTSILVRIPGEAASIITCIDGHEMAKQGRAGPGADDRLDRQLRRRHR